MTKVKGTVHWANYTGALRIACGRRAAEGGDPPKYTTDRKKVTCGACRRVMDAKRVRNPRPLSRDVPTLRTPESEVVVEELRASAPTSRYDQLRYQYAGAIGLLCELSVHLSDRDREERDERLGMIEQAVTDFCRLTGWTYRRILHRIEVFPPQTKGATADGKQEESSEG